MKSLTQSIKESIQEFETDPGNHNRKPTKTWNSNPELMLMSFTDDELKNAFENQYNINEYDLAQKLSDALKLRWPRAYVQGQKISNNPATYELIYDFNDRPSIHIRFTESSGLELIKKNPTNTLQLRSSLCNKIQSVLDSVNSNR